MGSDATAVALSDVLPASFSPTGFTSTDLTTSLNLVTNTLSDTVATLAAGSSITYTVSGTISETTPATATATVTCGDNATISAQDIDNPPVNMSVVVTDSLGAVRMPSPARPSRIRSW